MSNQPAVMATAYHEAGHAVAAIMQGIAVHTVTIKPGDNYFGLTKHGKTRMDGFQPDYESVPPRVRDRMEKQARCALAGLIAQRRFSKSSIRQWHAHQDHRIAADLVSRLAHSIPETEAWLNLLHIQTEQIIDAHWYGVEAIAQALIKRNILRGSEARALIRQAFQTWMNAELARLGAQEGGNGIAQ